MANNTTLENCDEWKLMGEVSSKFWAEFVAGKTPKRYMYVSSTEFESFQKKVEDIMQVNNDLLRRLTQSIPLAQ